MSKNDVIVLSSAVPTSVLPLTGSDIMLKPVDQMTPIEAAQAHLALKLVDEMLEERLGALREKLLDVALKEGKLTDKGGHRYDFEGIRVLRERREEKNLKVEKVVDLLKEKGIDIGEGCDEIKKLVVNMSKIQSLVEIGKLAKTDIDSITGITIALKIFPSDEIKAILEAAREAHAISSSDVAQPLIEGDKVKMARKK